jgi:hypothetical protein
VHKRRLQVDQIGEGPRYLVQARLRDPIAGFRLGLDNSDGCIGGGDLREQLVAVAQERICDGWFQRSTSPSAHHLGGEFRPTQALEEHRLARDLSEPCRQG